MEIEFFPHPFGTDGKPRTFGMALTNAITSGAYDDVKIVCAYATSSGTARVFPALQAHVARGGTASVIVGLANGVTSQQGVAYLLAAGANVHGLATGTTAILHAKVYVLRSTSTAFVAVGSANMTADGLYRNFEAMQVIKLDLSKASENKVLQSVDAWLSSLRGYKKNLRQLQVLSLANEVQSGALIDETATRSAQRSAIAKSLSRQKSAGVPPISIPEAPKRAPNLPVPKPPRKPAKGKAGSQATPAPASRGPLLWEKSSLPDSDAQRTQSGTNPVGGIRLTQAGFMVDGALIDQTTYFRDEVFANFPWTAVRRSGRNQEDTQVPVHVTLLGNDLGVFNMAISHKPSGEAGQGNYTTILHWGPILTSLIRTQYDLRGGTLRLYGPPPGVGVPFFLEVT